MLPNHLLFFSVPQCLQKVLVGGNDGAIWFKLYIGPARIDRSLHVFALLPGSDHGGDIRGDLSYLNDLSFGIFYGSVGSVEPHAMSPGGHSLKLTGFDSTLSELWPKGLVLSWVRILRLTEYAVVLPCHIRLTGVFHCPTEVVVGRQNGAIGQKLNHCKPRIYCRLKMIGFFLNRSRFFLQLRHLSEGFFQGHLLFFQGVEFAVGRWWLFGGSRWRVFCCGLHRVEWVRFIVPVIYV